MDPFFTGLLLAMVAFIVIVVVAFIIQKNQQKEKKIAEEHFLQKQKALDRDRKERIVVLARKTTSILSPYIGKFDKDFADERIANIWDAINRKFDSPGKSSSISEFAVYGTDQNVRTEFEIQIRRALNEDSQFADEMEKLLRQEQTSNDTETIGKGSISVGSINVGGDVSGNVSIGNDSKIYSDRLAGDETTDAPPPERKKKKRND